MKNSILLWKEIIPSPIKGFSLVNKDTKIALPLLLVLLIVTAASFLLLPVFSSDVYSKALVRVQTNVLTEKSGELSEEQLNAIKEQLSSPQLKTFTVVTTTAGAVFSYALVLFLSIVFLKLLTLIAGEKTEFRLLFRMIVFLAIFSAVQLLLKNFITVITDYERILTRVQTAEDLQWAISSQISLASLLSPNSMNPTLYLLIDSVTDIFNWLYYGYLYAALRGALNFASKKALLVTILFAVITIGIGLVMTLFV